MRPVASLFAASLALVACTQQDVAPAHISVPVMADYHESFDAIAFSGTLQHDGECFVLTGSDGTRYVPVFRDESDAAELKREFDLAGGELVTINGMNRFPVNGPRARDFRRWAGCGAYFFTYGGIDGGTRTPPPPANAPKG